MKLDDYIEKKEIFLSSRSKVIQAVREQDYQTCVIKQPAEGNRSPRALARFRYEKEMMELFDHPGIIRTLDWAEHDNNLFIVMEYGGMSLNEFLRKKRNSLNLDSLLQIAEQCAEALGAIHDKNVIHRDINPSNIVIDPDTLGVKIIDFGLSSLIPRENINLKNPEHLEGTIAYISPEQTGRINRSVDYRSDLYSLGVVFYELFAGARPFVSPDAMELVHCHIAREPAPMAGIDNGLPRGLSDLVMKLLAKNAEDRYQSAFGLKKDLEHCRRLLADSIEIKDIVFPLGRSDVSDRFQIPQKLYGREKEIETLLSGFDRAAAGGAELMLVAGYSGIGKSVLVRELHRSLTGKHGYYISGKFDQYQKNIPYSAVVNAFKEMVQHLLTEKKEDLALWKERLLTALGVNGQVIAEVIPAIELIIGRQKDAPKLGPVEARNRFNYVFQNFIVAFCDPARPLVLFLDDMQWVDSATLKLLHLIMTAGDNQGLYVIGAYRDEEVDPGHPFMKTLALLGEEGVPVSRIFLKPLKPEDINILIAETLNSDTGAVGPLTDLVRRKTGGNPFFINQFLYKLHDDRLIRFTPGFGDDIGRWQWEIRQIDALNITDNVVELMIEKFRKLPRAAQKDLRLAACMGNRFDLHTLAVIGGKTVPEAYRELLPALKEGLIVSLFETKVVWSDEDSCYGRKYLLQFSHDRIQQAAYVLMDDDLKQDIHLQIGRLRLENTSGDMLEEEIFDIVEHFNLGAPLLQTREDRLLLARLNLLAGQKAKKAMAYAAAVDFSSAGRKCLLEEDWEKEYDLAVKLYLEGADASFLSGDFEQMEALALIILEKVRDITHEVQLRQIQIQALAAQNRQPEAVGIALKVLDKLGVGFPEQPRDEDVGLAIQEARGSWAGKSIPSLIDLPLMTDVSVRLAMEVMVTVNAAAYTVAPRLIVLMVVKQVQLSLAYGIVPASCVSFVMYGGFLCGLVGDIDSGYQFGRLALDLLERQNEKRFRAQVVMVFNAIVRRWKVHAAETLPTVLENFQTGLESGDFESACYSIHNYTSVAFFSGQPLETLEREMTRQSLDLIRLKQELILVGRENLFHQLILNLMGRSDNPRLLSGEVYDENTNLPRHLEANDRTAVHYVYLARGILNYLWHDYEQALENIGLAEEYVDGVLNMFPMAVFHFFNGLVRLAVCSHLPPGEREEHLARVSASQEKLKLWAGHAPMNFLHKYELIEAERLSVLGRDGEAREHYDLAVTLAAENRYLNEEALAYQLAGEFYVRKNNLKIARVFLSDAVSAYRQWGATAVADHLESAYPRLVGVKTVRTKSREKPISTSYTDSVEGASEWLDLNSVIKAYQALSSEIVLARLLKKMIHIVIENAGAEKGYLVLPSGEGWAIEAEGRVDNPDARVLESLPVEGSRYLPENIVRYVANTRENLVLFNTARDGRFNRDAFIIRHQPKSVLCAPLIGHGNLIGILYLENNLLPGAFTPKILELANLLSVQIVMTLENSLLYDQLEKKVAERTVELKAANEELERLAKYDALTGLANRRHLDERLAGEWPRLKREQGILAVIMGDIDYFKKYNDYYGHQMGDDCLTRVARAIEGCLHRPTDFAGRYGGEEFILLLPNTDEKGARQVAEAVRAAVHDLALMHAESETAERVTMSLGVAAARPTEGIQPEKLISMADEALYQAKRQGRNRVCSQGTV